MANSPVFDFTADFIEQNTALERLGARGAVRLALKQAFLTAQTVTQCEMKLVVERLLTDQLQRQGVENAETLCHSLLPRLKEHSFGSSAPDSPDDIFNRLIRR